MEKFQYLGKITVYYKSILLSSHKGGSMVGGTHLIVRGRENTPTIHNNNLVFGEGKYKTIILGEFGGVLMAW